MNYSRKTAPRLSKSEYVCKYVPYISVPSVTKIEMLCSQRNKHVQRFLEMVRKKSSIFL